MKKILLTMVCASAIMVSAFAQLLDEKNVTITMDLQPVLQLSLQGPDQIDFTFDNINAYYAGITKYGANILRISASVSFDMWAVGLSQNTTVSGTNIGYLWDQVVAYQGGGASSIGNIPLTALELRQFPANPSTNVGNITGAACAATNGSQSDYSAAFAPYDPTTADFAANAVNNNIYVADNFTPYTSPTSTNTNATEKYIAGATGNAVGDGCQMIGGSYLMQSNAALDNDAAGNNNGTITTNGAPGQLSGYYFVMDYRILPGLPAQFPAADNDNADAHVGGVIANANVTAPSLIAAEAATTLGDAVDDYAAPGVYTMYIKYIIVEDQ